MKRTREGKESIVGRLRSSQQTVAVVVLVSICLISTAGIVHAQVISGTEAENFEYYWDFEDGSIPTGWQVEEDEGGGIEPVSYEDGYSTVGIENNNPSSQTIGEGYLRFYIDEWDAEGFTSTRRVFQGYTVRMAFVKNSECGSGGGLEYTTQQGEFFELAGSNCDLSTDTWYNLAYDHRPDDDEIDIYIWEPTEQIPGTPTNTIPYSASSPNQVIELGSEPGGYVDEFGYGAIEEQFVVSGAVTDSNNNDLNNVTIEAVNESGATVDTAETNSIGDYSLSVPNGTYDVTASKQDYSSETKQVTVSGGYETLDFQLQEFNQSIELDTRDFLEHGQSAPYSVVVSVDGDRRDVTGESNTTVVSNDTDVVTVDTANEEIVATSDTSVNNRTHVTANWTDDSGNVYTTSRNVTVANKTVENLGILPTGARLGASMSDATMKVILAAVMMGGAVAVFARVFAGLGTMAIIMTVGWFGGMVGNGMLIVSFMMAMFIGLNIAGNIDYTVRQ